MRNDAATESRVAALGPASSAAPRLRVGGLPPGAAITRADVRLAVDRPERLDIEAAFRHAPALAPPAPSPPAPSPTAPSPTANYGGAGPPSFQSLPPAAGQPIDVGIGDVSLFRGVIEQRILRRGPIGSTWGIVAHSAYEARRERCEPTTYFQQSDAEIARRIAGELGLRARVDPTIEVHERLSRREDPLRFLRRRARENGFELAITGGVLHFRSRLDEAKPAVRVGRASGVADIEVVDRGAKGRGGRIELRGDARLLPLATIALEDLGRDWDGIYRVARARHLLDESGWRSVVDILEIGVDFDAWEGAASSGSEAAP